MEEKFFGSIGAFLGAVLSFAAGIFLFIEGIYQVLPIAIISCLILIIIIGTYFGKRAATTEEAFKKSFKFSIIYTFLLLLVLGVIGGYLSPDYGDSRDMYDQAEDIIDSYYQNW